MFDISSQWIESKIKEKNIWCPNTIIFLCLNCWIIDEFENDWKRQQQQRNSCALLWPRALQPVREVRNGHNQGSLQIVRPWSWGQVTRWWNVNCQQDFRLPMKTFFQVLKSCSYIKFKINGYVPHSCLATCSFTRRMLCKGLLQIFSPLWTRPYVFEYSGSMKSCPTLLPSVCLFSSDFSFFGMSCITFYLNIFPDLFQIARWSSRHNSGLERRWNQGRC